MDKNVLEEYEYILKSNNKKISTIYIKEKGEKVIIELVKHVIENILHYNPKEAERVLTYEQLEHLKLLPIIDEHVTFFAGLNEIETVNGITRHKISSEADTIKYLLSKCYPKEIHFDHIGYIKHTYENVLDKKLAYPKGFYKLENNGKVCAYICFNYMLTRYIVNTKAKNVKELYALFSNNKAATKLLTKYKLQGALKEFYDGNTLAMLHSLINPKSKSEFYYRYYLFNENYKAM